MTEEDTFITLSRASVPEMLRHYEDWVANKGGGFEPLEDMCSRHGWTWQDFSVAGAIWREKYK